MAQNLAKYEEWLTVIANTRLIFNTIAELEDWLDNHSIHNNGIKRSFSSPQKIRAAFADLQTYVYSYSHNTILLDNFIGEYKKTWDFYRANLARRSQPQKTVEEILRYIFLPPSDNGGGTKKTEIYQQIKEQNINVAILIMLILKALPGYESKDGDVANFDGVFDEVLNILDNFVNGDGSKVLCPIAKAAHEEEDKSRMALYYYVSDILNTYSNFSSYSNLASLKLDYVELDIEGFWNECDGTLKNTQFWQIECAVNSGSYFMTHWSKDAENRLKGCRYTLFVFKDVDDSLTFYIQNPKSIVRVLEGLPLTDEDAAWYSTDVPEQHPRVLPLHRFIPSSVWQNKINLTRCTDEAVTSQYNKWLDSCNIIKTSKRYEYLFVPGLYAVTKDYLYVESENEGEYYKVPKSAHEGFDKIQMDDLVGCLQMNESGKVYIAFDKLLLYIEVTDENLEKYNIERVRCIE